ncbi:FMN-binding negative transcriptional regulator [Nonomuraea pusilla]|uniref:Negative transcriptional regulator, PaiB family n=1 Tax=Nonomuraea pusilla TaxID=46177 RepID=A0A1H7Y9Y7_9ACTN|nr:FMN-binding negative transcriptional regulator [Nonomuraea pusilla]SEM42803.1 negative transcriptional regulator, PaiB family [Nonomuraea pusilla]
MLEQPVFAMTDPEQIDALIDAYGWASLVTHTERHGLVVSHLPIVRDRQAPPGSGAVLGHLAGPDGVLHELGRHDAVLIVQGAHGYLSPSWYGETPHVPTWDFQVIHLHGRPEPLDADATFAVLRDTVDHFESVMPVPWTLDSVAGYAARIARGTVGFRLRPRRVVAKAKLSQDESARLRARTAGMLDADGPYRNPALAAAIRSIDAG